MSGIGFLEMPVSAAVTDPTTEIYPVQNQMSHPNSDGRRQLQ
jgi:hypothetical protein